MFENIKLLFSTIVKNICDVFTVIKNSIYEVTPIGKKQIHFGGCGNLAFYELGYAKYIQENINLKDYKIYGSSGGSIPCILLSTEYNIDNFMKEIGYTYYNNTKYNLFVNSLNIILDLFSSTIDPEYYKKLNDASSFGGITATHIKFPFPEPYVFTNNDITSNDDLINIMKASATIPYFVNNLQLCTIINNKYFIDSLFCIDAIKELIKMITFRITYLFNMRNYDYIYVSPWNQRLFSLIYVMPWYSKSYVTNLYELGYNDAKLFFNNI